MIKPDRMMELVLSHYVKLCERFLAGEFTPGLSGGVDALAMREMKDYAARKLAELENKLNEPRTT